MGRKNPQFMAIQWGIWVSTSWFGTCDIFFGTFWHIWSSARGSTWSFPQSAWFNTKQNQSCGLTGDWCCRFLLHFGPYPYPLGISTL
jgi:hypothetical protein